jgi:hypothetical protein
MQQPNDQTDPVVEILRLAYRRGLALRHQQEEERNVVNVQTYKETKTNPPPYKRVPPDTTNQET